MNKKAVDEGINGLIKINVPESWKNAVEEKVVERNIPDFVRNIQIPMARLEGDELPVSAFLGREDGSFPLGTAAYEKRGIAVLVPEWQIDRCIQCNQCSYICPHATIRPYLLTDEDLRKAPDTFKTKQATGKGLENYQYRIQVSPLDCTGCGNCADICPAPGKALIMKPAEEEIEMEDANWDFAVTIENQKPPMDVYTVKGSQFRKPLLEFNGACPGCGETAYVKLITQLYGDRMMVANATGCSSIWGGSSPSSSFCPNQEGKGPAWASSLFEDNAEYGYGMALANRKIREKVQLLMEEFIDLDIDPSLNSLFKEWIEGI